jgi:hypothetical protein
MIAQCRWMNATYSFISHSCFLWKKFWHPGDKKDFRITFSSRAHVISAILQETWVDMDSFFHICASHNIFSLFSIFLILLLVVGFLNAGGCLCIRVWPDVYEWKAVCSALKTCTLICTTFSLKLAIVRCVGLRECHFKIGGSVSNWWHLCVLVTWATG